MNKKEFLVPLAAILAAIFIGLVVWPIWDKAEGNTWLRQSTAVTVKLGPFVDATDATKEESLTITQAEVRLSKNGGDMAQKGNADALGHDELGVYDCNLSTTDTGTLGPLDIFVYESGVMLEWRHFMVVDPNLWDTFFSTGEIDIYSVRGVTPMTQANIETYSETGADASISSAALATAAEMAEVDANMIIVLAELAETDANMIIVLAELAEADANNADWVNGGRLDLILDETLVDANQAAQGGAGITAQQVWEDANATTASVAVLVAEAAEADANMIIVLAELAEADANHVTIIGDSNELQTDWANGGRLDLILDETLVDANQAAQGGVGITAEEVWEDPNATTASVALIVADSNELQVDWANGGRLDLILDTAASSTDANGIWEEPFADHRTSGTFGWLVNRILDLLF